MKVIGFSAVLARYAVFLTCHMALPDGWTIRIEYCLN
jgi:hypothetical protein